MKTRSRRINRPYRNPWAGYDSWKTSPPEDPPELQIRVECDCGWEGALEDAEILNDRHVLCPLCEEHIGEMADIIKDTEEGWE